MKKFIFALILGLLLVLSSTKQAKADCINKGLLGCKSGYTQCSGTSTCCFTAGECGQFPAEQTQTTDSTANIHGRCGANDIDTGIGCVPVLGSQEGFLGFILKWAVGIGGGIAFILIAYAGFMIMTSAGNPERLKAGQELMTSAISGLVLLVLSVFILKFIGIDILGLDKFGFGGGGTQMNVFHGR